MAFFKRTESGDTGEWNELEQTMKAFLRELSEEELGFDRDTPLVVYHVGDISLHHALWVLGTLYRSRFNVTGATKVDVKGKSLAGGFNTTIYGGRHAVFVDCVYDDNHVDVIGERYGKAKRRNGKTSAESDGDVILGATYIAPYMQGVRVHRYPAAGSSETDDTTRQLKKLLGET